VFHCGLFSVVLVSTTRIKDAGTTLWRQHSPSYDNNRAVQIPSTEPGHTVRRKRKSPETEYQYRKRQAVTSTIHIYFYLYDYTKANIYNFFFKSSCI
jgi:hypothetical protein